MFTTLQEEKLLKFADSNGWENRARKVIQTDYAKGYSEERRIKYYLIGLGDNVEESSTEDDIYHDIDIWWNGEPCSIKAQHSGVKYGNIYFELKQLEKDSGNWVDSWYYYSKAVYYMILQGNTLRVYLKSDVVEYVDTYGFSYERTLSKERAARASTNKRYINSLCGFLPIHNIKHEIYQLPPLLG